MTDLILGWGKTGKSIAKFLDTKQIGDYKIWDDFNSLEEIGKQEISLENIKSYRNIFVSPGIPPDHKVLLYANKENINVPISTDIDIFFQLNSFKKTNFIGITGTNGKSTCLELLKEIILESGSNVEVCGNVGLPILELDNNIEYEYLILELSSFQLHHVNNMNLDFAGVINITEDHIDWHGSKESYYSTKLSISKYLKSDKQTIIGTISDEKFIRYEKQKYKIVERANEEINNISTDIQNVIYGISDQIGLDEKHVLSIFDKRKVIANKFEIIGRNKKFTFINDSKATNFAAVTSALKKIKSGLLIMHGDYKGVSIEYLIIPEGVHSIVFFGEIKLDYDFANKNIFSIDDFEELPEIINSVCKKGDTIILSPGGSSFEHFNDYKHRGDEFRNVINKTYLRECI